MTRSTSVWRRVALGALLCALAGCIHEMEVDERLRTIRVAEAEQVGLTEQIESLSRQNAERAASLDAAERRAHEAWCERRTEELRDQQARRRAARIEERGGYFLCVADALAAQNAQRAPVPAPARGRRTTPPPPIRAASADERRCLLRLAVSASSVSAASCGPLTAAWIASADTSACGSEPSSDALERADTIDRARLPFCGNTSATPSGPSTPPIVQSSHAR